MRKGYFLFFCTNTNRVEKQKAGSFADEVK